MKNLAKRYLPFSLQSLLRRAYHRHPLLRRAYYLPRDLAGLIAGTHGRLLPPRSLISVGDGNFTEIGREFLGYFIDLGGLRADEQVLEIGCGVGRMAVPLTAYLGPQGRYDGFDIVRPEIRWCQRHITPRFANFHFHHIDVNNQQTNRKGRLPASSYRFPLADGQFDFVFLTSVFTHMLIGDIENYLHEISRLLKPGGRMLATYFLLDAETRERLQRTHSRFRHRHGAALVIDPKMPEASIAHEEGTIRRLYGECGLSIREPLHYGSWSGRGSFLTSQDIIVTEKEGRHHVAGLKTTL